MQSHSESDANHNKKQFWDPVHANLDENSEFGYLQNSKTCPGPAQKDKSLSVGQAFTFFVLSDMTHSLFMNKFMILIKMYHFIKYIDDS